MSAAPSSRSAVAIASSGPLAAPQGRAWSGPHRPGAARPPSRTVARSCGGLLIYGRPTKMESLCREQEQQQCPLQWLAPPCACRALGPRPGRRFGAKINRHGQHLPAALGGDGPDGPDGHVRPNPSIAPGRRLGPRRPRRPRPQWRSGALSRCGVPAGHIDPSAPARPIHGETTSLPASPVQSGPGRSRWRWSRIEPARAAGAPCKGPPLQNAHRPGLPAWPAGRGLPRI